MKSRKFPKKKKTVQKEWPRIEIIERRREFKPMDLGKQGQYSSYWKGAAERAKEVDGWGVDG